MGCILRESVTDTDCSQLSYDPSTGLVSATSPDDADPGFLEELQQLNYTIKTVTMTNDNPQPLPQGIPPQFQMKEYIPPPPRPIPNVRSNAIAQKKEEGNTAFRLNKYPEAIKQYTFSAALSATRPTFESAQYSRDELSVALCNRSAAYAADGKWIEALVDANAVIGLKKNWTKGHFRKGKALLGLKQYDEARQAILLGLEFEPANEVGLVFTSCAVGMV